MFIINKLIKIKKTHNYLREGEAYLSYDHIPNFLKSCVICIEDRRFYYHPGIDLVGICRAFITNLLNRKIVEGASTITQQLVRRHVLSKKRSYFRKVEEILLSVLLECILSKKEILEFYLNTCYFGTSKGRDLHGIEAASQSVFGKMCEKLSFGEMSFLAAMIGRPLTPFSNESAFMRTTYRQHRILSLLHKRGVISKEQQTRAIGENIIPFNHPKKLSPMNAIREYQSKVIHPRLLLDSFFKVDHKS